MTAGEILSGSGKGGGGDFLKKQQRWTATHNARTLSRSRRVNTLRTTHTGIHAHKCKAPPPHKISLSSPLPWSHFSNCISYQHLVHSFVDWRPALTAALVSLSSFIFIPPPPPAAKEGECQLRATYLGQEGSSQPAQTSSEGGSGIGRGWGKKYSWEVRGGKRWRHLLSMALNDKHLIANRMSPTHQTTGGPNSATGLTGWALTPPLRNCCGGLGSASKTQPSLMPPN